MKKVKVMLMAIMVLAIAGGALAFKTKFGDEFCKGQTRIFNEQPTCTDQAGNALFCTELIETEQLTDIVVDPGAVTVCTTTIDPVLECDIPCPVVSYTTVE